MQVTRFGAIVAMMMGAALLGVPPAVIPARAGQADRAALIQTEKHEWDVAKNKDWAAYNQLLAQDFIWIDDGGVVLGRTAFLKYVAALDLTDYAMEDVKVTMFNGSTAMLTYKVTLHGKFGNQAIPPTPSYVSSEYIRRGGHWWNVFTQTTGAKQ